MNLRAPYTREEWAEICRALKDERKRRHLEHLPRLDQMAIVDRVLTGLRSPAIVDRVLTRLRSPTPES